jgi:hypothetical protein
MTIQSAVVSVGTSATALSAAEGSGSDAVSVAVSVPSGGATVYVGGSDVTTGNGYPVAAGQSVVLNAIAPGERVYGIVAASTQNVNVLRQGVG